jgi:hypothetical protein
MKSQTNSKEIGVKSSSREESRKSSVGLVNTFIKKFNRTNPITINSKTLFLNSQRGSRPEVKPIKMPNQSVPVSTNHSRYAYSQRLNCDCRLRTLSSGYKREQRSPHQEIKIAQSQ